EPHAAEKGRQVSELHQASLRLAYENGVPIAFGTDAAGPYHLIGGPGVIESEFRLMVESGMPPIQVFKSATSVSAAALGTDELGSIQAGLLADLVVYDGDPLTDFALLSTPSQVYRSGVACLGR